MIYKFNTSTNEHEDIPDGYLEISSAGSRLHMAVGLNDPDDLYSHQVHYLPEKEIDDLIIALTQVKNEISLQRRQSPK